MNRIRTVIFSPKTTGNEFTPSFLSELKSGKSRIKLPIITWSEQKKNSIKISWFGTSPYPANTKEPHTKPMSTFFKRKTFFILKDFFPELNLTEYKKPIVAAIPNTEKVKVET